MGTTVWSESSFLLIIQDSGLVHRKGEHSRFRNDMEGIFIICIKFINCVGLGLRQWDARSRKKISLQQSVFAAGVG